MRNKVSLILLAGAATLVHPPAGHAEVRTFHNPTYQGYRLDYCQSFGRICGERVATQWCREQGYQYASDWSIERDVGAVQPTMRLGDGDLCQGHQCDGFADITCGREGRSVRLPDLGALTRATVITPDRTGTAPSLMPVEVQVLVPGCHQWEPGILLCETVHEYQHCRTLLREGRVLGCRAGTAFEGAFAEPRPALPDAYDVALRSRVSATVFRGRRGEGRLRGEARYEIEFDVPDSEATDGICLQRDRYVYRPTGPEGGLATIDETAACEESIAGRFSAHEDDLYRSYDLCESRNAWGSKVELATELMVAGLFHFASPMASELVTGGGSRIIAPFVTLQAPVTVDCRD